jgi:hypothetical protein
MPQPTAPPRAPKATNRTAMKFGFHYWRELGANLSLVLQNSQSTSSLVFADSIFKFSSKRNI